MSWHDESFRQRPIMRRITRPLVALVPALLLAGCLHPLYGSVGPDGASLAQELRAIDVQPIPKRLGHYLGNDLIFALNGTGAHVPPKYKLIVTTSEGQQSPLVDTVTGLVTASTVVVRAHYTLLPLVGGKPIAKGVVFVAATYDRTSNRFSDMRAARNAEQRDAHKLADQIRTQLAAALSTRS